MIYHKHKGFYKKFSKKQFRKLKKIEIEFGIECDDYFYYDYYYYEYIEDDNYYKYIEEDNYAYYRHFSELVHIRLNSNSYNFYDFEGNFLFNSYEI